eukprot:jgi/Phyca11/533998/estExt2_fgenesh1_pg.C_PHYCAscaffold_190093
MFDAYNQKNNKAALVGNWVEEDALRDRTGFARRKVPTPLFAPASTRYADFAAEKPGPGPRSSLRDQYLVETAKRLHNEQRAREREEKEREHKVAARVTVAKSSFMPVDSSALVKSRVPRGCNGSLARQVDPNIQHLTKAETDSIDQMKLDLLQGTTVTRYSYAVTAGVGLDFPTTVSDGNNAFGRSTLKRLLNLLKNDSEVAEHLLDALRYGPGSTKPDQPQQEDEYIELHDFRAAFSAAGAALPTYSAVRGLPAILTDKEVIHIFMFFDRDNIGAIQVGPFLDYCTSQGEKLPFTSQ